MVPDGTAFRWASEKNPYFLDAAYLAYLPQPLLEGLICSTLGHRMMTTAHATGSSQAIVLAKKMQYHRGRALGLLSEYIADPDLCTHEITLASILSLLLSEVCISPRIFHTETNTLSEIRSNSALPLQIGRTMQMPPSLLSQLAVGWLP